MPDLKTILPGLLILAAQQQPVIASSWYESDRQLCNEIESKGLSKLIDDFEKLPANSGSKQWLKAFNLASRAANQKLLLRSVKALSTGREIPDKSDLSEMANILIARKQWAAARFFFETFPQAEAGWTYIFINEYLSNEGFEKADQWLKERAVKNPDFWTAERARAAVKAGKEELVFKELKADLESSPGLESLKRYISASSHCREPQKNHRYEWISSVYKPQLAFDSYMAATVCSSKDPALSVFFLERSLSLPYSKKDDELMRDHCRRNTSMPLMPDRSYERDLRVSSKQLLARAYKESGDAAKAQAMLLDLSREEKGSMPVFALTQQAGQIQSQLPAHPLEKHIIAKEKANENDSEYWRGRAKYYLGRKEEEKAQQALLKALSLAKPVNNQKGTGLNEYQLSCYLFAVNDYAHFLQRSSKNSEEAVKFLYSEYDKAESAVLRQRIINSIWSINSNAFKYDEAHVWAFLKECKLWEYLAEKVLMSMTYNLPQSQEEKVWKNLSAIAGAPLDTQEKAIRLSTLGWVMSRRNQAAKAVPLLKESILLLKDQKKKQNTCFTLFEAELYLNNWKEAEAVFPEAKKQLQSSEMPEWLSKLSLAAARSGAFDDALRIWVKKDNLDRSYLGPLKELSGYPKLKSNLIQYYQRVSKQEPASKALCRQAISIMN